MSKIGKWDGRKQGRGVVLLRSKFYLHTPIFSSVSIPYLPPPTVGFFPGLPFQDSTTITSH